MSEIKIIDKGVIEYTKALEVQTGFFDKHFEKDNNADDILLYCEHPHVYTLGKSGHQSNLLASEEYLKSIGASFYKTDRGGDITYHGYGQLVGYPILNLRHFNLGLKDYINRVEECVIKTIKEFGIDGYLVNDSTGVWVMTPQGEKKICAIGVKASRYITMHGFALNVNTDLSFFHNINPCGFTTKGVTSISELCNKPIDMDLVKKTYSKYFYLLFK